MLQCWANVWVPEIQYTKGVLSASHYVHSTTGRKPRIQTADFNCSGGRDWGDSPGPGSDTKLIEQSEKSVELDRTLSAGLWGTIGSSRCYWL